MKKQNKNFLYSLVYQIFNIIIPFLTIPYVSRVLGIENIGIYAYTYSIVSLFVLAAMLGINNYGSREIAKRQNDKIKVSRKFFSIYLLQFLNSLLLLTIYLGLVFSGSFKYKEIMLIQTLHLFSAMIDINWFYFGLEKFKVTVTRNIIIKVLSIILIFLLIKNKDDLWLYALITGISTVISQMYLWLNVKKELIFKIVSFREIFSNLKPCLVFFIPVVAYSIYRVTDKTMIGSMSSNVELGYYENAEKIISIPLSFIAALGAVMMPRMSATKNKEEAQNNIQSSFMLTSFILLPMAIGLFLSAEDFVSIFFGDEFKKTYVIIKLLVFTFIFSGIASVVRTNYLIPNNKNRVYVSSTILGALINFIINFICIPKYGAIGACIGTVSVELIIMSYQILATRKSINYQKIFKACLIFAYKSILMGVLLYLIGMLIDQTVLRFVLQVTIGSAFYLALNIKYLKKDFLGKINS